MRDFLVSKGKEKSNGLWSYGLAVASSVRPMKSEQEAFENSEERVYVPSQAIRVPVTVRK